MLFSVTTQSEFFFWYIMRYTMCHTIYPGARCCDICLYDVFVPHTQPCWYFSHFLCRRVSVLCHSAQPAHSARCECFKSVTQHGKTVNVSGPRAFDNIQRVYQGCVWRRTRFSQWIWTLQIVFCRTPVSHPSQVALFRDWRGPRGYKKHPLWQMPADCLTFLKCRGWDVWIAESKCAVGLVLRLEASLSVTVQFHFICCDGWSERSEFDCISTLQEARW